MDRISVNRIQRGFTLIELMIVVAIIAILAGVSIPAYFTYIQEAAVQAALSNIKTMRVSVEDFRLNDNAGEYPDPGGPITNADIDVAIGWDPGNMGARYNYTLDSQAGGYSAFAIDLMTSGDDGNPIWARCDNNMQLCCTSVDFNPWIAANVANCNALVGGGP